MTKGDRYYFARCLHKTDIFEVLDVLVRTINEEEKWFTVIEVYGHGESEHFGQAHLFYFSDIGKNVFSDYISAKDKVSEAMKHRVRLKETYFEED